MSNLFESWGNLRARRKAAFHKVPLEQYRLRVARTPEDYEAAFRLVHSAYTFLGVDHVRPDGMRVLPEHMLPESTVIVAYEGDQIVGTVTVIEDSSLGLPLGKLYPEQFGALRQAGKRVVELASFVVVQRCWDTGVTQLLSIAAYNYAYQSLGATHAIIGVNNEGSAGYYRGALSFQAWGAMRPDPAGEGALVLGLVQDMLASQPLIAKWFPKPMASGKPAIEHFRDQPPPCIELPPRQMSRAELMRWKLPRDVFQRLFVEGHNRLEELSPDAWGQLSGVRTRETLMLGPRSKAP